MDISGQLALGFTALNNASADNASYICSYIECLTSCGSDLAVAFTRRADSFNSAVNAVNWEATAKIM